MREILFRGKRVDSGEWVHGSLLCFKGFQIFDNTYNCWISVKGETIGQYAGLTDKNGTKIFEGDILDCVDRIVFVKWHSVCGQWDCNFIKYKGILCSNGIKNNDWKYRAKVIGNIHDNPKLLNN